MAVRLRPFSLFETDGLSREPQTTSQTPKPEDVDDHFKKFLQVLNKSYRLPSSRTFRRRMGDMWGNLKFQLTERLAREENVAVTQDGWTSIAHERYITVTAHWIDESMYLRYACLALKRFPGSHDAPAIKTQVARVLSEFKLKSDDGNDESEENMESKLTNKIVAGTSDNASNVLASWNLLKVPAVRCAAHTLNLIARSLLEEFETEMKKCRDLVSHYHRSPIASDKLNECALYIADMERLNKLVSEVVTRWNSVHDMVLISITSDRFTSGLKEGHHRSCSHRWGTSSN